MPIQAVGITDDHRRLLGRLHRLMPDMDADDAASLQRIFRLGLLALAMQVGDGPGTADNQMAEAAACGETGEPDAC